MKEESRYYYPPRIIEMHKRIREIEAEITLSRMPTIIRGFLYRNRLKEERVGFKLHHTGKVSIIGH